VTWLIDWWKRRKGVRKGVTAPEDTYQG
jgi:hypothetical protein